MKRLLDLSLLSLLLITFSLSAMAQPSITAENFPDSLTKYTMVEVETEGLNAGAEGENVIWDFSHLKSKGGTYTVEYIDPSSTPYSSDFPNSNLAQKSDDQFNYYLIDGNEWIHLGKNSDKATDTEIMLKVPLGYGDSLSDTFAGQQYWNGSVTTTADGYGTLITPNGTYNNVIRMKVDKYYVRFNGYGTTKSYRTTYSWYDSQHRHPIASVINESHFADIMGEHHNYYNSSGAYLLEESSVKKPELYTPEDGATDVLPDAEFTWGEVDGADAYELRVAKEPAFETLVISETMEATMFSSTNFEENTTYYWSVRTIMGEYYSDWSPTFTFTTDLFISVKELSKAGIKIYPNPASDKLNIDLPSVASNLTARIFSASGDLVKVVSFANTASNSIDVSSFSTGTYILELKLDGTTVSGKFIVQ